MRLNPPKIQLAPGIWAVVCSVGLVVFVQKLFEFPVGSSGWQGGIAGIVLVVFGFLSIELWWLASQREIAVDLEAITIRSWLELFAGRPGSRILWSSMRSASLVFESGRKLEIVTPIRRHLYWAAMWNPSVLTEFLRLAGEKGIPTRTEWLPGS